MGPIVLAPCPWNSQVRKAAAILTTALIFFSGTTLADKPDKKTAILIDAYTEPRCYGLDCPPWPVPEDGSFCFQVGSVYYAGSSHEWGFAWNTAVKKLLALKGSSVEIVLTDKDIRVTAPHLKMNLFRMHSGRFSLPACNHT
jgi:hypothetical protein